MDATQPSTPPRVVVTDVTLRDGLQSLGRFVPTEAKLRAFDAIVAAGITSIEVTSFVRPDVVPALRDAEELMRRLPRVPGVRLRALVPNQQGAERAVAAEADELVALVTVSDAYARRNQGRPAAEVLERAVEVLAAGREAGVPVDVVLAVGIFDPYAGDVPPERVEHAVRVLRAEGATSFCLATSTGLETPFEVRDLLARLRARHPDVELALHLHDANRQALATVLVGLEAGVRRFEAALCGIGGGIALPDDLPTGNLPTEDLVAFLASAGCDTGLDPERVGQGARAVAEILEVEPRSVATSGHTRADLLRRLADATPGG